MGEIVDDQVLISLDRLAFSALLERLPAQADELRARRRRLQHKVWRAKNKATVAEYDRLYRSGLSETERRRRWKDRQSRYRLRKKRAALEEAVAQVKVEMKGTRGNERALLKARLDEYLAALGRLSV